MKKIFMIIFAAFVMISCGAEGTTEEENYQQKTDRFFQGKFEVIDYKFIHDLNNNISVILFWEFNGDIVNAKIPLSSLRFCYDESATSNYMKFKYYYNSSIKNTSYVQDCIDKGMIYAVIFTNSDIKNIIKGIE